MPATTWRQLSTTSTVVIHIALSGQTACRPASKQRRDVNVPDELPRLLLSKKTPRSATFCSGPFSLARFLSPSAVPEVRRRPSGDSTRTSFAHLARSCFTAFVEEGAARQLGPRPAFGPQHELGRRPPARAPRRRRPSPLLLRRASLARVAVGVALPTYLAREFGGTPSAKWRRWWRKGRNAKATAGA